MSLNRGQLKMYEERLTTLREQGKGECDEAIELLQALCAFANERDKIAREREQAWGGMAQGLRNAICLN